MKYGIWANENHWASPGMLGLIGSFSVELICNGVVDGMFYTTDLNIAFRYLQVLRERSLISLEVKEKQ